MGPAFANHSFKKIGFLNERFDFAVYKIEIQNITRTRMMNSVYVIIENGDPYESVYSSFASAVVAVKEKYQETIDEQIMEQGGGPICSEIDVPEDLTGKTYLYVEKGIHIYIYKLPFSGAKN